MKFFTFVAAATAALVTLFSSGADAQTAQPIANFYPVTGAIRYSPNVVRRMKINDLASTRPDIYNMFILALQHMQTGKLETDPLSYYQLSGIHGVPFIPWQETSVASQDDTTGYCTHTSVLFATWHRPFLVLFEERLLRHAIYVASRFTGSQAARHRNAANNVRLPYWDWASNDLQSRQPVQLTATSVTVVRPGAGGVPQTVSIPNPLREYRFTNANLRAQWMADGDFGLTDRTRRQPPVNMQSSNNAAVDREMTAEFTSRRTAVFNLFTIPTFSDFSGNQLNTNGNPNAYNSVESIHNGVHVAIGGERGHMTAVAYSSFDPIFWLHHCNVDRLVAMYQAVNPGRVVAPRPAAGTFSRRVADGSNLRDNIDTPLTPFRKTSRAYYTSRDVSTAESIWSFGYSYSEVPIRLRGNPTGMRAFTSSEINRLYGPGSTGVKRATDFKRREWICHMTYDIGELKDSSTVKVYFDKPPSNETYPSSAGTAMPPKSTGTPYGNSSYEGPIGVDAFYAGSTASLKDPKHIMHMSAAGAVYLSDCLLQAGCKSLDPEDVVPFLKERLRWVVSTGYTNIPLTDLPSLKVGISSAEAEYSADESKLPVYGEFVTHYDVTEKKKCGFTHSDEGLVDSTPAKPVADAVVSLLPTYNLPKPTYVAEEPAYPTDASEEPTSVPTYEKPTSVPTYEKPTSGPSYEEPATTCTKVNGGITTLVVTSYSTVCPSVTPVCPTVYPSAATTLAAITNVLTTAFTAIYPDAPLPTYSVF